MKNLRPISEMPVETGRTICVERNDGTRSYYLCFKNNKFRAFGLQDGLLWGLIRQNSIGWYYLNEFVKIEWKDEPTIRCKYFNAGAFMVAAQMIFGEYGYTGKYEYQISYGKDGEVFYKVSGFDSIKEAQAAAIKWYNDNLAALPKAEK